MEPTHQRRPRTGALNADDRLGARRVYSVLAEVELSRASRRSAPKDLANVPVVLSDLYLVELTPVVRQAAGPGLAVAAPGVRHLTYGRQPPPGRR